MTTPLTYDRNRLPAYVSFLTHGGIVAAAGTVGSLGARILVSSFNPLGGVVFTGIAALISSTTIPLFNHYFVKNNNDTTKGFIAASIGFTASFITAAAITTTVGIVSPAAACIITAASVASLIAITIFFATIATALFGLSLTKAFLTHSHS